MQEPYRPYNSFVHRLDARVKVIFTLAFIISLSLTPPRAWPAFILFLALILSAALLSHLGLKYTLLRAFIAVPFFLAALPLVFTGVGPKTDLAILGLTIQYNPGGLGRFASIAMKTWISVQAAIILAAATRFSDLLVALKQLKVPQIFVAVIGLMWRYLFVIGDEATRLMRARASRSAFSPEAYRAGGRLLWRARVTGGMAGSLFLRSLERSDRVYAAMLTRGYNGELPQSENYALSQKDKITLWAILGVLALVWILGVFTGE